MEQAYCFAANPQSSSELSPSSWGLIAPNPLSTVWKMLQINLIIIFHHELANLQGKIGPSGSISMLHRQEQMQDKMAFELALSACPALTQWGIDPMIACLWSHVIQDLHAGNRRTCASHYANSEKRLDSLL